MKGFIIALTALATALTGCEKATLAGIAGRYAGPSIYSYSDSYTSAENCLHEEQSCSWMNFLDEKLWTADFDLGSILNGECTYRAEDDKVFLARYIGSMKVFEYRLEKVHQN